MTSASTAVYAAAISPVAAPGAAPDDADEKLHHRRDGKGFTNPWASYRLMTFGMIAEFMWRQVNGKANKPDITAAAIPAVHTPRFLPAHESPAPRTLRATWLGHACYLVEFPSGLRALFDPVWEPRCSPFSFMGPKRYTAAPVTDPADLPRIDAVFISHNHYDHLSYPTVRAIAAAHPRAQFFVPLGNRTWFVDTAGVRNVTEMDWWEERELRLSRVADPTAGSGGKKGEEEAPEEIVATIGALPSQHVGARGLFDRGRTLWASWSIASGGRKLWFAGDTGYRAVPRLPPATDDHAPEHAHLPRCPAFAQIGALRGPFDLGLLPIGAYAPRYIMSPVHADPVDAVDIFTDTRCRRAAAMHWGTWVLTEEEVMEPVRRLGAEMRMRRGEEGEGAFEVLDVGESRVFE